MRAPRETSQRPLTSGLSPRPRRYATPTGPGRCRLFARFPFRFPPPKARTSWLGRRLPRAPNVPAAIFRRLPDWLNHMGQLKVLDDDIIFLSRARFLLPSSNSGFTRLVALAVRRANGTVLAL